MVSVILHKNAFSKQKNNQTIGKIETTLVQLQPSPQMVIIGGYITVEKYGNGLEYGVTLLLTIGFNSQITTNIIKT